MTSLPDWLRPFSAPVQSSDWGAETAFNCFQCEHQIDSATGTARFERVEGSRPLLILRSLGEGGMGAALLAVNPLNGDLCVCKIKKPDAPSNRFYRESYLLSKLDSDQFVRFRFPILIESYDRPGETTPGFLMEYVSGGALQDLLTPPGSSSSRRLPFPETMRIVLEIVDALEALHSRGWRHRDLKPGNVLFDLSRGRTVKLCDLGMAKDDGNPNDGTPGIAPAVGTYGYDAPELQSDPDHADHRADYFSLGCVLAEMLTGEFTFQRTRWSTARDSPIGLKQIERHYGIDVRLFVERLLHKAPDRRLTDPLQIKSTVERLLQGEHPHSQVYWSNGWKPVGTSTAIQRKGLLFHDARSFENGRLKGIGDILAIHAEQTALVELADALAEIHRHIWLLMNQVWKVEVPVGNDGVQMAVKFKVETFEKGANELFDLVSHKISASLVRRIEFVDVDKKIIREVQSLRRRAAVLFRRDPLIPESTHEERVRKQLQYMKAIVSVFRGWLGLQHRVHARIAECAADFIFALNQPNLHSPESTRRVGGCVLAPVAAAWSAVARLLRRFAGRGTTYVPAGPGSAC
jgi:serine/threonine protein kinase